MKTALFIFTVFLVAPLLVSGTNSSNEIECSLCKWGTGEIENFLSSNFTETKIESSLTGACSYLPEKYKSVCDTVLVPLVPQIIEYLDNHETPDAICGQLHLCPTELVYDDQFTLNSKMFITRMLISGLPINAAVRNMIMDYIEVGCY